MTEPVIIYNQDFWLTGWRAIAKYMGYSIKSCKRMVKSGLPKHSSPFGRPMFKASEIDYWIKKREKG